MIFASLCPTRFTFISFFVVTSSLTHSLSSILTFDKKHLTTFLYHLTNTFIIMDAALNHLTDRRTYLRLARQIVTNRQDNLNRCDDEFRSGRLRLLLKLYLTSQQPLHRQKRRRLLLRLGRLTKVLHSNLIFNLL